MLDVFVESVALSWWVECVVCALFLASVLCSRTNSRLFVSHLSKLSPIQSWSVWQLSSAAVWMANVSRGTLCALLSVINSIFIHDCSPKLVRMPLSVFARYGQQAQAQWCWICRARARTNILLLFCRWALHCTHSLQLELLMMLMMCSRNKWGNLQKCCFIVREFDGALLMEVLFFAVTLWWWCWILHSPCLYG